MTEENNIPPRIYHENDPDGVFALWKEMVQQTADDERAQSALFEEIADPDTTPAQYLDLMLKSLGNPFARVYLTELQKRKLVKLLIPMYRQKGIGKGIVNAFRFLTGIEVEIVDPHASDDDGWSIGVSEVSYSTYVGGERIFTNILNYSEDFDETDWVKSSATVDPDTVTGPNPWAYPADTLDFSAAGCEVSQAQTPTRIADQNFNGSIWLKAASAVTVEAQIRCEDMPTDETTTSLSVTTDWTRFEVHHLTRPDATGKIVFAFGTAAGFSDELYAWGAQLVRDDEKQPYVKTLADGEDNEKVGAWAYHFFIQSPVTLTESQEKDLRMVADFVKAQHQHYNIINPEDLGFIDHWEVGISEISVDTYVHA